MDWSNNGIRDMCPEFEWLVGYSDHSHVDSVKVTMRYDLKTGSACTGLNNRVFSSYFTIVLS